jgi:hypothetical protein
VIGQLRSIQRRQPVIRDDEGPSTAAIIRQAGSRDGRAFRMLTVIDEFTRRSLAIVVARKFNADQAGE